MFFLNYNKFKIKKKNYTRYMYQETVDYKKIVKNSLFSSDY